MSEAAQPTAARMYGTIWNWVVALFRVPQEPPTLPARSGEYLESFRPAPGYLKYLKFWFWLLLWPMDIVILIGWIGILIALWWLALLLLPFALFLAIAPDVLVYVGLHLKYDTMWYVMTERSLRIRRGIWIIHETTITFENVQNLKVQQGPLQRHFGIADLVVETAGAGAAHGKGGATLVSNQGVLEGIDMATAQMLRDRILKKLRTSSSAGLGDEPAHAGASAPSRGTGWTQAHLEALRAIRDETALLAQ